MGVSILAKNYGCLHFAIHFAILARVESLLFELEAVFAIDVAAFAIMSNHLHLVLHIDIETANRWTDREVLEHSAATRISFNLSVLTFPAVLERKQK